MDDVLKFLNTITGGRKGFVLELFICEMLFCFKSKRRKISKIPFPAMFIVVYAVYFAIGYFVPNIPVPSFTSLMIFATSVLATYTVFAVPVNRTVFTCVAGYAVQNLAVNVCNVFLALVVIKKGWVKFFVKLLIKIAIYVGSYFLFAKKSQKAEMTIRHIRLYLISLITIVITSVMFSVVHSNGKSGIEISFALTLCGLIALMLQFSEFKSGNLDKETITLERLLYYEQKQHELTQEAIDLINIKCHDLKKQVNSIKELLGDKAELVLGDTEKALSVYSDMVNTGNKNLDLIISEEKLHCNKLGIIIDVMADGAQLDFMTSADIYSLFSNALNNAVESVIHEKDGNRNIGLDVHLNGDYVCIKITNVCTRPIEFVDGFPVTSKEDKNFHGYGIRSMEYIVDKYGGNMVIDYSDNIFLVKIIIKVPK